MNYGETDARPTVMITRDLIKKLMPKYKRHGDLIIIQEGAWDEFKKSMPMPVVENENSPFSIDEDELASLVCQTISSKPLCRRVAIERAVRSDAFRTPNVSMLLGESGLVTHKDNMITYQFDVTKCMFSFGNVREKMRMAELDCSDEVVVDLFAGIGYFTLPLLVHAKAKHLYACEWNPDAVAALRHNLALNKVARERYTVIEGDNRLHRPTNVAQRVMLGILPSSMDWMKTALCCVDKKTGAILHCHDLVERKPAASSATAKQASNVESKQNLSAKSQNSDHSTSVASDKTRTSLDNQSIAYQSLTSSSNSSHSAMEKLSTPPSEDSRLLQSSESSDKDTCSPVMLDRPSPSSLANASSNSSSFADPTTMNTSDSRDQLSLSSSSQHEDSILEKLADSEIGAYEARGLALIASIQNELETNDLVARLLHIQPVKSYAPHVNHVVFDIMLEPRSQSNGSG